MTSLPPLTPAQLAANTAKSARSPLGEGVHYVNTRDEHGPVREACTCAIGEEHDRFGRPERFAWPEPEYHEAWRWAPVLGAGAVPLNSLESTIGARDE